MEKKDENNKMDNTFGLHQIGKDKRKDTKQEEHTAELGAGRQLGDPMSATLSDRAGDESFDDDTRFRGDGKLSEEADDM